MNKGDFKKRIKYWIPHSIIFEIIEEAKNDLLSRLPSSDGSLKDQIQKGLEYCPAEVTEWFVKWFGDEK